jgi:hypothetical protein
MDASVAHSNWQININHAFPAKEVCNGAGCDFRAAEVVYAIEEFLARACFGELSG